MIMITKAPYGDICVHEAIEIMFIMATYEMNLSVVFADDAVFALKQGQDVKALDIKSFLPSLGALVDWEVTNVFVEDASMQARHLKGDQLVSIGIDEDTEEAVFPKLLSVNVIRKMMDEQNHILSF